LRAVAAVQLVEQPADVGLDPNSTVNARGGPTYAGALLAHWLDCLVGFYVAAFLLGRLLVRNRRPG